jgi:hypothetical protein
MKSCSRFVSIFALLALLLSSQGVSRIAAQSRLSDKDIEQRIKNVDEDTKKFHKSFDASLAKSALRKTSQEKDAKNLAVTLEKQTKALYDHFKQTKKADPYLQNMLDTATQVENVFQATQLDPGTVALWSKIKSQLSDLARAFNLPGY